LQLVKSKIHLWRKNYDLINGSGVNLDDYAPTVLPEASAFLMVGRLTGDKGINEYVEAAVHVKAKHPEAEFYLVGPEDDDDKSVNVDMLNKAVSEGVIQYAGKVEDVRPFINRCRVFVLPSYHEGTPRTVLEAMSMGRPIITTDATGCRETVEEGVNGFKVPVKSKDILAEKMIWMIEHPDETAQMGVRSRRMCEKKYDVRSINKKIIKNLEA
jgi:glycosyltransferase involved in cell wall biosynthesis